MGAFHDCHTAEYNAQQKEVQLLGTTNVSNESDDLSVSADMEIRV